MVRINQAPIPFGHFRFMLPVAGIACEARKPSTAAMTRTRVIAGAVPRQVGVIFTHPPSALADAAFIRHTFHSRANSAFVARRGINRIARSLGNRYHLSVPRPDLAAAVASYAYPAIAWDFSRNHDIKFGTIRQLDVHLNGQLRSGDQVAVKDAPSSIVYWGNVRAGYCQERVRRFREKVTDDQIRRAIAIFPGLKGTGLYQLKALRLPEFSNMAFLTKLRTFLAPDEFCVLDKKIATLKPLAERLKLYPTCIPITAQNDAAYAWWVDACRHISKQFALRPVDVERGLFHLLDVGLKPDAERILSELE